MIADTLLESYEKLFEIFIQTRGGVVAFSGGVDSSLLLYAAVQAMPDRILAVSVSTPYMCSREMDQARQIAEAVGIKHVVLDIAFPKELRMNPPERCYLCKKKMFGILKSVAEKHGFPCVFDGTNHDDLSDYRPGLKALKELKIRSPLLEVGLTKQNIRGLSRHFHLPTWDSPSLACLLSRIPAGVYVEEEALARVEQAEIFLKVQGFSTARVRNHGDIARIEIPQHRLFDIIAPKARHAIDTGLKELGYRYVAVELTGYHMGSLNHVPGQE